MSEIIDVKYKNAAYNFFLADPRDDKRLGTVLSFAQSEFGVAFKASARRVKNRILVMFTPNQHTNQGSSTWLPIPAPHINFKIIHKSRPILGQHAA